jgi:hypothetical protein
MSATGTRTELARYRVSTGERIVYGQRILGVVRVTDAPAKGKGRRYLVDRELPSKAELDGLVSDYLDQADRWDDIPLLHLYPDNEVAR